MDALARPGTASRSGPATGHDPSRALFVSYDGLTDPLGRSQILPYLRGLASQSRKLHVLSFEKPGRYAMGGQQLAVDLAAEGIGWTPLSFSQGGKLLKAWDLLRMYATALVLNIRHRFGIIHCRSYQAAQVGCFLKRISSARVLFDMRGLWVDERIDGGLWSRDRLVDRMLFRHYKRVERKLLECADHVVALTERVIPELRRLAPGMQAPVTVIPCCADFSHFRVAPEDERMATRRALGIPEDAMVMSYLGSLGTWYCLDEMLDAFVGAATAIPDLHFLLVTRDWRPEHLERFRARGGMALCERLHVREATREEVPGLVGACDVMISFIKPAYSKIASSPTKLAEAFACGVPVICNPGIGDVDAQVAELHAGGILDLANASDADAVVACIRSVLPLGGHALRARAHPALDLEVATRRYRIVYDRLEAA